jgi:hypothetical protein
VHVQKQNSLVILGFSGEERIWSVQSMDATIMDVSVILQDYRSTSVSKILSQVSVNLFQK